MAVINRRRFLQSAAGAAGALALGGPFQGFTALAVSDKPSFRQLRAIPDLRDGQVRLHLPEGFQPARVPHRYAHPVGGASAGFLQEGRHHVRAHEPRRPRHADLHLIKDLSCSSVAANDRYFLLPTALGVGRGQVVSTTELGQR